MKPTAVSHTCCEDVIGVDLCGTISESFQTNTAMLILTNDHNVNYKS